MRVSAVVPTWCEAENIAALVARLRDEVEEVIVADANSPDATAEEATRAGAYVVRSEKGRGAQMDAGAAVTRGDVIVFVHADTTIPVGFAEAIRSALNQEHIVGGNFRLRFTPVSWSARVFTWGNHVRRLFLRIYYGDSCIFVRSDVYRSLGGFRQLPLFEDHAFVRKLEKYGKTFYVHHPEVNTSARRFESHPFRVFALWTALQTAYIIGVSPWRLARFYADHR